MRDLTSGAALVLIAMPAIVSAQAPVFTSIYTFIAATDGANPESSLILSGANLFGATA
ncbi:MAG TPA: hypothetical protein VN924_00130 [Bryobacteraceae bacterium]|nr:hypothetical protein [Bryobacteraceae bacterium]